MSLQSSVHSCGVWATAGLLEERWKYGVNTEDAFPHGVMVGPGTRAVVLVT